MLGIMGLVCVVVAVTFLIWKNWHMAIVSLVGTIIVIVFNGMNPVSAITKNFTTGVSGFAGSQFLLFMLGSIFDKVMGENGASVGTAGSLLKLLGGKSAVLVIMTTGLMLSYGGIGAFIIAFSVYPIAVVLFQKADIPKKLAVATIMMCSVTVCMATLPGSPSMQNLLLTTYFNITAYAGTKTGTICSVLMFAAAYPYLNWQIKAAKTDSEHFVASPGENIMDLQPVEQGKTPEVRRYYAPIVVLLVVMFGFRKLTAVPSTYAVSCVMILIIVIGCILYKDKLDIQLAINDGASGGLGTLIIASSIMGFGSAISASPAYGIVTGALVNMNTGPLTTAPISINVIVAITGLSAGGLNIFPSSMGGYLASTGLNTAMLHRVVYIASSGFDAMPHASGMTVYSQIARTSQKNTYKHMFITCAIMPFCRAILACVLGTMGII